MFEVGIVFVLIAETKPFAFTVALNVEVELPKVPILAFTVANVKTVEPVASPVCVALETNPLYCEFVASFPVFVPLKLLPVSVPLTKTVPAEKFPSIRAVEEFAIINLLLTLVRREPARFPIKTFPVPVDKLLPVEYPSITLFEPLARP